MVGKQRKKKRKGGKEGKKDWEGSDIGLWVKWEIYVEIVNKERFNLLNLLCYKV